MMSESLALMHFAGKYRTLNRAVSLRLETAMAFKYRLLCASRIPVVCGMLSTVVINVKLFALAPEVAVF